MVEDGNTKSLFNSTASRLAHPNSWSRPSGDLGGLCWDFAEWLQNGGPGFDVSFKSIFGGVQSRYLSHIHKLW